MGPAIRIWAYSWTGHDREQNSMRSSAGNVVRLTLSMNNRHRLTRFPKFRSDCRRLRDVLVDV